MWDCTQIHDGVQPLAAGPALTSCCSRAETTPSLEKSISRCSFSNDCTDPTVPQFAETWHHLVQDKVTPDGQYDSSLDSCGVHWEHSALQQPTAQQSRLYCVALTRLSLKRRLRDGPSRLSLFSRDPGHDVSHRVLIYGSYINFHAIASKM